MGLDNNVLMRWSSSIKPNSRILIDNPLTSQAGHKNALSIAPIKFFYILGNIFFDVESTMYVGSIPDKNIGQRWGQSIVKTLSVNSLSGEFYYSQIVMSSNVFSDVL